MTPKISQGLLLISLFIVSFLSLVGGVGLRAIVESYKAPIVTTNITAAEVVKTEPPVAAPRPLFSSFLDSSKILFDEDENAFLNFKKQLINNNVKFVEIDLRKMQMFLYEGGQVIKEIPVLSKGRDGSWWETPTGKYSILTKEANHFSSIGKVWMPWSMQFYGNFFIHGWPYYPDGSPVTKAFSGGCVRLSTEDAKVVFDFIDKGTPVLVLDEPDNFAEPNISLTEKVAANLQPPLISAKAALITDLDSGLILLNKNADEVLPIASLTKLQTAVVASELINLERSVKASPLAFTKKIPQSIVESRLLSPLFAGISLIIGKSYTAFDLLYPLLMQSSNEAASTISSFLGREEFVKQMNNKAESLGMANTTFTDTSGKDNGNISTAKDLAKLSKYILEKRNFLFNITKGEQYLIFGPGNFGGLQNYNEFANQVNLIGVKNGETTAAKQTMSTVWQLHNNDGSLNQRFAVIVLGSEDRRADTEKLVSWLGDNFGLH